MILIRCDRKDERAFPVDDLQVVKWEGRHDLRSRGHHARRAARYPAPLYDPFMRLGWLAG